MSAVWTYWQVHVANGFNNAKLNLALSSDDNCCSCLLALSSVSGNTDFSPQILVLPLFLYVWLMRSAVVL